MLAAPAWAQEPTNANFRTRLRAQYDNAILYFMANQDDITNQCTRYNVPARVIVSIVFPEVMRFNQISNFMESSALHIAYTNGGKEAADFSIGVFQMKPSFVEQLEQAVQDNFTTWGKTFTHITQFASKHDMGQRYERLQRLEQFSWQMAYACCFYTYIVNTYGRYFSNKSEEDKIWFLASAYNVGIQYNSAHIERIGTIPNFPYGVRHSSETQFVYGDISLDFYLNTANPFFPK